MTVTILNLIQGPAQIWVSPFGTAEPANNSTPPGAGWVDAGATDSPANVEVNQTYGMLTVEQIAGPVDARLTDMGLKIAVGFAEATLANYRTVFNQVAAATTFVEVDPTLTNAALNYAAVLVRGPRAGGGGLRSIFLRKALNTDNVASSFAKEGKTLIPAGFTGLYVSPSIKPIRIDDTP